MRVLSWQNCVNDGTFHASEDEGVEISTTYFSVIGSRFERDDSAVAFESGSSVGVRVYFDFLVKLNI